MDTGSNGDTKSGSQEQEYRDNRNKGILEDMEDDGFEEFKMPSEDTAREEFDFVKKKQKSLGYRDRLYSSSEIRKPHE